MLDDANLRAVVAAIQQLAKAMQLEVVAEGIENEAQFQALQGAGCRLVQGHLLGKAMSAEQITAILCVQ